MRLVAFRPVLVWGAALLSLVFTNAATCIAEESEAGKYQPRTREGAVPISEPVAQVTLAKQNTGERSLQIDYPWTPFKNASVEVALVTKNNPPDLAVRPIYFVDRRLKSEISVVVGQCLQAAYDVGQTQRVQFDTLNFDIVGHRNTLARPAVSVLWKFHEVKDKPESKDARSKKSVRSKEEDDLLEKENPPFHGAWAAFCELENWSINSHELMLDLPQDYFSNPGKLYVWFLRGDKILWTKKLDWKGF
jgi:hypothetical protein